MQLYSDAPATEVAQTVVEATASPRYGGDIVKLAEVMDDLVNQVETEVLVGDTTVLTYEERMARTATVQEVNEVGTSCGERVIIKLFELASYRKYFFF